MSGELQEFVVRRIQHEAEKVKSYVLAPTEGNSIPTFSPGSHIIVQMPGNLSRQYSLTNAPWETDAFRIAVLREDEGRGGSAYMHDHLSECDRIAVSHPINQFPLDETAARYLLIAGGIGVTPILAMAKHLDSKDADFEFHYCARTERSAAFASLLKECAFSDRVTFHFDDGDPARGLDIENLVSCQSEATHVYFCGPTGFMNAIEAAVSDWAPARVHSERFSGVSALVDQASSFEIELSRSGQVHTVPADTTVLKVLRDAGHDIDSVCEEGICGSCIVDVLNGVPDHRDNVLSEEERAGNKIMTVCCSRSKSSRLVLDI